MIGRTNADGVGGIDPDDLNATPSDVITGKFFGGSGTNETQTGIMPIQEAKTVSLICGSSYTIPAGYHNGSGKVTVNSLSSQTGGTATAGQILSGQTAWVNGSKITGSMTNQGSKTSSLNCGGSYSIPAGYHNGSGKITVNSLASQTNGTATAAQLLSGRTAWVNGSKLTGTIVSMGAQTITPNASKQTVTCSGKYMTGNIIINGLGMNHYKMKVVYGAADPEINTADFILTQAEIVKYVYEPEPGRDRLIKEPFIIFGAVGDLSQSSTVYKTTYGTYTYNKTSGTLKYEITAKDTPAYHFQLHKLTNLLFTKI